MTWNPADIAAAREGLRSKAKNGQTENTVPRFNVLDVRADRGHDTRDFVPEDASIRCFTRIKRERLEHIAEIHSRGFDIDHHFAWTAGGQRERTET